MPRFLVKYGDYRHITAMSNKYKNGAVKSQGALEDEALRKAAAAYTITELRQDKSNIGSNVNEFRRSAELLSIPDKEFVANQSKSLKSNQQMEFDFNDDQVIYECPSCSKILNDGFECPDCFQPAIARVY